MRLTIRFDGVILSEAKNPVRDQDISKANDSAVRLNICRRSFRKSMSFALANQVYTPSATPQTSPCPRRFHGCCQSADERKGRARGARHIRRPHAALQQDAQLFCADGASAR